MTGSRVSPALIATAAAALAAGTGAIFAVSAYVVGPAALPALAIAAAVGTAAVLRPEVGVAAAVLAGLAPLFGVTAFGPRVVLGACLLLGLLSLPRRAPGTSALPPLGIPVLLLVAAALVAVAVSGATEPARQLLLVVLTGAAVFWAASLRAQDPRSLPWLLGTAAVAALLIGGRATYEYLTTGGSQVGFVTSTGAIVSRVLAGFSQPNQLGGFLAVLVPLTTVSALGLPRLRPLLVPAAVLAFAGLTVSFSRAALVALVVVPLVLLRPRTLLKLLPLALLAGALLTPEAVQERFATVTTTSSELIERTTYWRSALVLWGDHPLLGVGLGGFPDAYASADLPWRTFLPATLFQPPPHAHNLPLHVLAEQGLLGLIALGGLLLSGLGLAARLRRAEDPRAAWVGTLGLATLAVFALHNLLDVTFFQLETAMFVWLVLGVMSGTAAVREREEARG